LSKRCKGIVNHREHEKSKCNDVPHDPDAKEKEEGDGALIGEYPITNFVVSDSLPCELPGYGKAANNEAEQVRAIDPRNEQ
jgi:hypothetical protein